MGTGSGLVPELAGDPPIKADKDASDDEGEDDGRLRTAFIGNQPRGGVLGSLAPEAQVCALRP